MFNVKLVFTIVAAAFLVTQSSSLSQEKTITCLSGQTIHQKENEKNPKTRIFNLSDSRQAQFKNTTTIQFELGVEANVLTVCDPGGKIIEALIDDLIDAGDYSVNYKSADKIVSGQFIYKLEVKGMSGIKMYLL